MSFLPSGYTNRIGGESMKHYSHQAFQHSKKHLNVEFGSEFSPLDNYLDKEAQQALLSAKAGGMITKRLVEAGEQMLMNGQKKS